MGTKKGEAKEYVIKYAALKGFYITLSGGGQLPSELTGGYTSEGKAKRAIELYERSKETKRKVKKPEEKVD